MWNSYKKFTKEFMGWVSRASIFRPISTMFYIVTYGMIWLIGSMLYLYVAAIWLFVKTVFFILTALVLLVVYFVRLIYSKITHREPPPFPKLIKPILHNRDINDMSGVEFEKLIADKLRRSGFKHIRMTPTTGDYGVDIIATKEGVVYAFQCKRYSGSVGVRAVQEIYAGCKKYGADIPVVVTNSHYTPNAREMADDLGVALLDLELLDAIFD